MRALKDLLHKAVGDQSSAGGGTSSYERLARPLLTSSASEATDIVFIPVVDSTTTTGTPSVTTTTSQPPQSASTTIPPLIDLTPESQQFCTTTIAPKEISTVPILPAAPTILTTPPQAHITPSTPVNIIPAVSETPVTIPPPEIMKVAPPTFQSPDVITPVQHPDGKETLLIPLSSTTTDTYPLIKQQTGDDATPMVTTIPLSPPKPSAPTTPTAPKPMEKTSPVKVEAPKVELVDCPMCFQQFLPSKIEQHAANCTGGEPPAKETAPKPTEIKAPPLSPTAVPTPSTHVNTAPVVSTPVTTTTLKPTPAPAPSPVPTPTPTSTPLETLKPTPALVPTTTASPTPTSTPNAPVQHPDAKGVQLVPAPSDSSPTDSKATVAPSTSTTKSDSSWGDILKKQEEMLKSLMAMVPPSTLSALAASSSSSSSIKSPESIGANSKELQPLIKQQQQTGSEVDSPKTPTTTTTTTTILPSKPNNISSTTPTPAVTPTAATVPKPVKVEDPSPELVDCPMCFQQFLPSKIEQHAANCTGGEPPPKETAPKLKPMEIHTPSSTLCSVVSKTETCPICAQEVPTTQIVEHVEMCLLANEEAPSTAEVPKTTSNKEHQQLPPSLSPGGSGAQKPPKPSSNATSAAPSSSSFNNQAALLKPTITTPVVSSSHSSSASPSDSAMSNSTPSPASAGSSSSSSTTSPSVVSTTSAVTTTTTTKAPETTRREENNVDEDEEGLSEDCPSCGKPFPISEIFDHVKTCKPRKKSTVETCPLCFLTFPASEMEDHLAECVGSAPKAKKDLVTTCPLCSKLFPVSKMEAHVKDCILVKKTRPKTPPSSSPATAAATSAATAAAAAASAAALQQLQEMLPFIDDEAAKEALSQSNGNVEAAVAIILGTQGSSDDMFEESTEVSSVIPPDTPADLRKLMFIFPHTDLITLKTTLESGNGDVNRAVAYLMGGDIWDLYADEIPEGVGITALPCGNDVAPGESIKKNGVIIRINKKAPCQSFYALKGKDPVDLISSCLPGGSAQFCAYCFCTMIQREQKHYGDFYVFYHSYSLVSILYELQSEIASVIYGMSSDFPPLPRLFHAPFRGKKTLAVLQSELRGGSDHNVSFRALAIAASNGLFATTSEMHPITCFMQGYSCGDLAWPNEPPSGREADEAAKKVIDIGAKYFIPTSHFGSGTVPYYGPNAAHPAGNMLQIFIHKDILDDVAYPCQPGGYPIAHHGSFSEYLKADPTGQTRIFAFPALFVDRKHAFIYHYCANQDLCCPDSKVPGSRGALKRELRAVLKPVLGTPEGRRAAFQRIQAKE
ncbi:hypothetical protein Pelo_14432 [Pelomyxa schiedti]|nr:hypothetical protein Pelo_14432 [Pelomyxa schiedti]